MEDSVAIIPDFSLTFQIAATTILLFLPSYLSWFYDETIDRSEHGLGMLLNYFRGTYSILILPLGKIEVFRQSL